MNTTEQLCQFYNCIAPEFDPDGFRLYFAAQEISGIRNLYECFPYEDARGCFEAADGHALLRWLTARHFGRYLGRSYLGPPMNGLFCRR